MSDKFFFQGGQAPNLDHSKGSYSTKAGHKSGTKKYPLQLIVGSEQRKTELVALAADNELFAEIHVIEDCEIEENVAELMVLVNKGDTVEIPQTPNRNEPCSCGSGKKYKKCCG